MMKVSLLLEAVNRASGPIDAALRSVRRLGTVTAGVSRGVGGSMMAMFDRTRDATAHFRTIAGPEGMARAARSAAYLRGQLGGVTSALSFVKFASAAAVIGLGEEFVRGVFKAGGEMQGMLVTLTKLEGGANNARKAMGWMRGNFAFGAGMRFSFPDIMKSYQMAKESGMNPQGGSLASFADLAAAWQVPLGRVLFAVKDAMLGTSTRPLANLGIKMHRSKDGPVTFNYQTSDGKNVTLEAKSDQQSILAMIQRIVASKYGGLATAQGNTVPGKLEQLKKMLYIFQTNVWSAGVGDWAMSRLNQLLKLIQRASNDGSWDRFAKRISDFITGTGDKLIAFFIKTDWASVGRDIAALAGIIATLAGGLGLLAKLGGGGTSGLMNLFVVSKIIGITGALTGFSTVLAALGTVLFGLDIAAAPITVAIAAIGALVAVGYLLWANWGRVASWWTRTWNGLSSDTKTLLIGLGLAFASFITIPALIIANWSPIRAFFTNLWRDIGSWRPPAWMTVLANLGSGNFAGAAIAAMPAIHVPRPGQSRLKPELQTAADRLSRGPAGASQVTIKFDNPPPGMKVRELRAAPGHVIDVKRGPIQVAH